MSAKLDAKQRERAEQLLDEMSTSDLEQYAFEIIALRDSLQLITDIYSANSAKMAPMIGGTPVYTMEAAVVKAQTLLNER